MNKKKVISMMLALVMIFSISAPAFADSSSQNSVDDFQNEEQEINISNLENDIKSSDSLSSYDKEITLDRLSVLKDFLGNQRSVKTDPLQSLLGSGNPRRDFDSFEPTYYYNGKYVYSNSCGFTRGVLKDLLWLYCNVNFEYDGTNVISSDADFTATAMFPYEVVVEDPICYNKSNDRHDYKFKATIYVSVPTPWGGIHTYQYSISDRIHVFGDGSAYYD